MNTLWFGVKIFTVEILIVLGIMEHAFNVNTKKAEQVDFCEFSTSPVYISCSMLTMAT